MHELFQFSKVYEKKIHVRRLKGKYKENKTNFEGAYPAMAGQIQLKFGIGGALPQGRFHSKTG